MDHGLGDLQHNPLCCLLQLDLLLLTYLGWRLSLKVSALWRVTNHPEENLAFLKKKYLDCVNVMLIESERLGAHTHAQVLESEEV